MVEEGISSKYRLHSLYSCDEIFVKANKGAFQVSTKEMVMMSALTSPSEYLAVFYSEIIEKNLPKEEFILALDGISDPGNLGTIIRTADWFGVRSLLLSNDCVELFNPKTVQSTMGSIFRMNVHSVEISSVLKSYKDNGYVIIGAALDGEDAFSYSFPPKAILVIGSESHGIRKDVIDILSDRITIPGGGNAESLNAAVACSILLSKWFQR